MKQGTTGNMVELRRAQMLGRASLSKGLQEAIFPVPRRARCGERRHGPLRQAHSNP